MTEDFCYTYNKLTGLFESLQTGGEELLDAPVEFNIWRAPVDNDRKMKGEWMAAGYDRSRSRAYETEWKRTGSGVEICSFLSLAAAGLQKVLDLKAVWEISDAGTVSLKIEGRKDMEFPPLPRFGIRLFLKGEYRKVDFYGLGPWENYADKRRSCYHDLFETTVEALHEDYIRPQENGSHGDCDYVQLYRGKSSALQRRPLFHFLSRRLTIRRRNWRRRRIILNWKGREVRWSVWITDRMESVQTAADLFLERSTGWIRNPLLLK